MLDRYLRLLRVNEEAEALMAEPGFERRFDAFLREDQIGRWQLDGISGYYWFLHALIEVTRPRKVLELGRCLGTSTLFMLGALPEGSELISVDISASGTELAHMADDPRLRIITGNDLDLDIYSEVDITEIDFLFIDTDHTNAQASKEWNLYRPFLSETAIVAFDDITMNDMGTFWTWLDAPKFETGTKYHYTGFGLVAP